MSCRRVYWVCRCGSDGDRSRWGSEEELVELVKGGIERLLGRRERDCRFVGGVRGEGRGTKFWVLTSVIRSITFELVLW